MSYRIAPELLPLTLLLALGMAAYGFQKPQRQQLPNIDKRIAPGESRPVPPEQHAAVDKLRLHLPRAQVDFEPLLTTPKLVRASDGFLTGPNGQGRGGISAKSFAGIPANDPHRVLKAFLKEHQDLFSHGPEALDKASVKQDFVTPHSGMHTVAWQQQLDGIPIFEAILQAHTTKLGELVQVSSQFIPDPQAAGDRGTGNKRQAQINAHTISAQKAIALAALNIGDPSDENSVTIVETPPGRTDHLHKAKAPGIKGLADAKLIWLPIDKDLLRLCWDLLFTSRSRGEMFRTLVDTETGEILVRHCLTEYVSDASYRVYTSDSPSPFSPGYPTPVTDQPPLVDRTLVTLSALDTNASPNGWIDDGVNETRGNNVDAHTDRNGDNAPDLPRPQGSPSRIFDFPLDPSTDPTNYSAAAVVQLFYRCNWMHDRLYELGFTEAAGNFQNTNFNRGGLGNDALQADAQDGEGTDNANMSTPPDGSAPRMQMFIFTRPRPRRDGDLDSEVVLHEYTHGLSNRRVGTGVGLSALQSRGMGEGWSDFYATALLGEPGDDINGVYAAGAYASYLIEYGFAQNYYFGIRRYPYCTDMQKNPLTFKDIDIAQALPHTGVPLSPWFMPWSASGANEVHNQGEVWCMMLLEARANFISKYGYTNGNELFLRLVTDGMNLSPVNPTFIQARDGIIQADRVYTGGANYRELWMAFAKRGLGYSATSPASSTTSGVHESYDLPDDLVITPALDVISRGPVGGPFSITGAVYTLNTIGSNAFSWILLNTSTWLNVSLTSGSLGPAGTTNFTASLNSAVTALPMGVHTATLLFSNEFTHMSQIRSFRMHVGLPDYFTELFDYTTNDLAFQSFTFTPDSSQSFYSVCRDAITNLPTDPANNTLVTLTDDSYARVALATNVSLYGRRTNSVYIGSNGYLTLGAGDDEYIPTFFNHFLLPRVAALFDDLNPPIMGSIGWTQVSNRVAVTWFNIVKYGSTQPNTFQIELFFDGRIRVSFLQIYALHSLIGLSAGLGVPPDFDPSDFSAYPACGPTLQLTVPATATEGDGILSAQLTLLPALATNLVVTLLSSDTNEVLVPPSVGIPAGQTNVSFDLTIVDDARLDGTQTAVVSASAPGANAAQASVTVYDDESAQLTITTPASAREGDGSIQAVLSIPAPADANVLVRLTSSDPSELQVPPSVGLPAGQTSVVFTVTVIDDNEIDGPRNAILTAQVQNWLDGQALITILDNENLNLSLTLPVFATEGDGILSNAGVVAISGTLLTNLVVNLASDDTTELVLPPSAVILPGQTSARFNLSVIDDVLVDSNQTVTVTAQAPGFQDATTTIVITDNESPPIPAQPSPPHLATNLTADIILSWSCGTNTTNEVYFGTNPTPGPAEYQALVIGTNWTSARLAPMTTYYWQIVSHRIGVTAGPVWQFTTRGVDHFQWSTVSSPQAVNRPFSVTVTAKDYLDRVVTNFPGPVTLNAQTVGSGSILEDFESGTWPHAPWILDGGGYLSATNAHDGAYGLSEPEWTYRTDVQIGNSGESVSWWIRFYDEGRAYLGFGASSAGCWSIVAAPNTAGLILQQNLGYDYNELASLPQTWVLGRWYKVDVQFRAGASILCQVYDSDGVTVLNSLSYSNITGLPGGVAMRAFGASLDTIRQEGTLGPVSSSPTASGAFSDGSWTGDMRVLQAGESIFLSAQDNLGHTGSGNRFAVQMLDDLSVSQTAAPDPVEVGALLTYTLQLANSGPSDATEVALTNWLPAAASFVSCTPSQGTCTNDNGIIRCALGTIPGSSNATVVISVIPLAVGSITNRAAIGRAETDSFLPNNSSLGVATVNPPSLSISDSSVIEGDIGSTLAVFEVRLSTPSSNTVIVSYSTSNGTAVAGMDFIPTNGLLTFIPGQTTSTLAISVLGDFGTEPDKTFYVLLSNPVNGLINRAIATGTILDDDGLPGKMDHFAWSRIPSPQQVGVPFLVTITAQDSLNDTVSNYAGIFNIFAQPTPTSLVFITNAGPFLDGSWTGALTWFGTATNMILIGEDYTIKCGAFSNPFHVAPDGQPPIILTQPRSQTVDTGVTAVISVSVFGTPPLSCQWYFNGTNLLPPADASLVLSNVDQSASGTYSVLITNAFGSASSATVYLNVVPQGEFFDDFEPGIHLAQWSGFGGAVLATNYAGAISRINSLWLGGDGIRYALSRPINTSMGGTVEFYLRLADGGTFPWEQVDLPEEGVVLEYSTDTGATWVEFGRYDKYEYTIWTHIQTDIPLEAQSTNVVFRWRQLSNSGICCDHWALDDVGIFVSPRPPFFLAQPASRVVHQGLSVTFNVVVNGTPPFSYAWMKDGTPLSWATNDTLTLTSAQVSDAGLYSVLVANAYGSTLSSNALLTVVPVITLADALNTPGRMWINIGYGTWTPQTTVTHDGYAAAQSGPISSNQYCAIRTFVTNDPVNATFLGFWWKISSESGADFLTLYTNDVAVTNISGEVDWQYFACQLSPGYVTLQWRYAKNAFNNLGQDCAWLDEVSIWTLASPPVIAAEPQDQVAAIGGTATFSVGVLGTAPFFYQWYFNGTTPITGATNISLVIPNVQPADAGTYNVVITNDAGAVTSRQALLEIQAPPFITEHPQSQTVAVGSDVTLNVTTTGGLPISYCWKQGALAITNMILYTNTSSYTITNAQLASAGVFSAVITNRVGSATGGPSLGLTRDAYIVIVDPPTNQVAGLGSTVTFSAKVNFGTSNVLGCQWRFNGADLEGATSTNLVLTNVACADSGIYTFVVTNQIQNPTGFDALLTVLDTAPPVLTCPSDLLLYANTADGLAAFFDVSAFDNCGNIRPVTCLPPSGSPFPLGTNSVLCTAVSSNGVTNQCQFSIRVVDRAAFTLTVLREGANLVVTWPKAGVPRQLEIATRFSPADWTAVSEPIEDTGNTFTIRFPITTENKFLRLKELP